MTSRVLRLGDGRALGYREVGLPDGSPILYCHGTPSSSAEWRLFGTADELAARGLRLIAPSDPAVPMWRTDAGSRCRTSTPSAPGGRAADPT